jgi:hypothetical protein
MKIFKAFLILAVFVVLLGMILALPTWFLWNYCLVGAINGVNPINIFQAGGLVILAGILFKTTIDIPRKN